MNIGEFHARARVRRIGQKGTECLDTEVRRSRSRQITQNAAVEELGYVCRISSLAAKHTRVRGL